MLKKLLKYDMKSVWNIWWILAISVLGTSVVGAFLLRFFIANIDNESLALFSVLGVFLLFFILFGIIASIAVTQILVYMRFYKNFFTDEGYLTFTLPVSRQKLFLSKTLNALIWTALHLVLYLVCVFIFLLLAPPSAAEGVFFNPVAFDAIGSFISNVWQNVGGWLIVYIIEGLLLVLLSYTFTVNLIHFCITMGAIVAKKLKLLAAIGIYYLVNMGLSFLIQFASIFGFSTIDNGLTILESNGSPEALRLFATALVLFILCLIVAAFSYTVYCITLGKLERKLNLT